MSRSIDIYATLARARLGFSDQIEQPLNLLGRWNDLERPDEFWQRTGVVLIVLMLLLGEKGNRKSGGW